MQDDNLLLFNRIFAKTRKPYDFCVGIPYNFSPALKSWGLSA